MDEYTESYQNANNLLVRRTIKGIIVLLIFVLIAYLISNKYIPDSEYKEYSVLVVTLGVLFIGGMITHKSITSKQRILHDSIEYMNKEINICPNCGQPRIKMTDFNNWICHSCYTNGKTKELKKDKISNLMKKN